MLLLIVHINYNVGRAGRWTVRQRIRVRDAPPPSPLFYISHPPPLLLLGPSPLSSDSTYFICLNRPAVVVVDALASALASSASAALSIIPPTAVISVFIVAPPLPIPLSHRGGLGR